MFKNRKILIVSYDFILLFVIVQLLGLVWLFATPWTAASQPSLSFTISWSLLKLMSIELVMPSNHLVLCHPRLLLYPVFPLWLLIWYWWIFFSYWWSNLTHLRHTFWWLFCLKHEINNSDAISIRSTGSCSIKSSFLNSVTVSVRVTICL